MPEHGKSEKKKVVFIIEDDLALVRAYQMKLSKEGVEVWAASDGKEALARLTKPELPSVVLLDLMLPGVSGFEILEAMQKSEPWKAVPVIVLSNLGQQQDIERSKALGVRDYMIKANVRIGDVVEKIKEYL